MKSMILMCFFPLLSFAGIAQLTSRVRSGTPLRWSMNGSIEIMEGDLKQYYGSTDSAAYKRNNTVTSSATIANPHAVRFLSVQAQCDNNSMQLKWVAMQQTATDWFEIEQSDDGVSNWRVIGSVPVSMALPGETSYNFSYNKNAANSFFRIAGVATSNERLYSSIFKSPCSVNSYLSVVPNPVYSTATLRIGSLAASKIKILVGDAGGVIVQSRDFALMQGTNNLSLNLSSIHAGYYTLAIQWMSGKQDVLNILKQ
jgi:hypothetical protein